MSDEKLRELGRVWADGSANLNQTVAYLAELRRAGLVAENECRLAWRIYRIEAYIVAAPGTRAQQAAFDNENPEHAKGVLTILVSQAPALGTPTITRHPSPDAIADVVRGVLAEERRAQRPSGAAAPPLEPRAWRPGIDGPA